MYFTILESGSKGNCTLIESGTTKVIVDCGGNKNYLLDAFKKIDIDYTTCDALLLTHEHSDHIKQIKMFNMLPIYTPFEVRGIPNEKHIEPMLPFQVGSLTVLPLLLSHDTDICVGYIFFDGKQTLVQVTDTGYLSEENQKLIKGADYYIFESNHDEDMLMATSRPMITKKRILSKRGHMSNKYAAEVLSRIISSKTKQVVLAHISQEANDYHLAYQTTFNSLQNVLCGSPFIKAIRQFEIYSSREN